MKPPGRIRHFFGTLELRDKIRFALWLSVGSLTLVFGIAFLLTWRYHLADKAEILLEAHLAHEKREIELQLSGMLTAASSIANSTVAANALADSRGREAYLEPLLRDQLLSVAGADLSLLDYRGNTVASSGAANGSYETSPAFNTALQEGRPGIEIMNGDEAPRLLVALPIRYRLTGNIEGAVLLRVPLSSLMATHDWASYRWLQNDAGLLMTGQSPPEDAFVVSHYLDLPAPIGNTGIMLALANDKAVVYRSLNFLLLGFVVIALLLLKGISLFARAGANEITQPLSRVAEAAEQIARTGKPEAQLPVSGNDEFARLVSAFNIMVERLGQSYGELEVLLAERTRDYEQSRQRADWASNLLFDAVQSVAVGFAIYDENDLLVICNKTFQNSYAGAEHLLTPGVRFAEFIRGWFEQSGYAELAGDADMWVQKRLVRHREADAMPFEQPMRDGRWLLIGENRMPNGYTVINQVEITELKNVGKRLELREAYLRATLDNLPFMFWLKDAEGHFLAVNRRYALACGRLDPQALVGLTDHEVWEESVADKYRATDLEVIESRQEKAIEEATLIDNVEIWSETYKRPIIGVDGQVIGTVGFSRDISLRKHMEQALAESEERWNLALRGANDGVWDWNLKTGLAFYSERWAAMLGYGEDEIGDEIDFSFSLLHPDDAARVSQQLQNHLDSKTEYFSVECRMRCRDGSYKWIFSRGKCLLDSEGKPVRMAGSSSDITERRLAEAKVLERNEQLDTIFSLSPDGFVSFDESLHVKYVNPAFLRMTGLEEGDAIGLDEAGFVALLNARSTRGLRLPDLHELRIKGGEAGTEGRHLLELAPPGNRVIEVAVRSSQGGVVPQIFHFRDITREVEVDRLKSEFLSTAAHELRTPMSSIFGFSELLLAHDFGEAERKEFLGAIYKQASLMVSIINELLDLARIEARRGKDFNIVRLSVGDLLREIVANTKTPPERSDPQLLLPAAPQWIRADSKKITQAVANVLSNAYKYSPDGGEVVIELLDASHDPQAAGRIGIRISDQGMGMSESELARLFERFFRADTSGKIPGTGLGMSIVKEIIDLHGGEVEVHSQPGQGTQVTLWLAGEE